jgi:hypothetical protein
MQGLSRGGGGSFAKKKREMFSKALAGIYLQICHTFMSIDGDPMIQMGVCIICTRSWFA